LLATITEWALGLGSLASLAGALVAAIYLPFVGRYVAAGLVALAAGLASYDLGYARAILRSLPVFHCDLNRFAPAAGAYLKHLVADQHNYHKKTAAQAGRSDAVLEILGIGVLVASALVLTLEIMHAGAHGAADPDPFLRFLAVSLPAIATALYGIRLLGDFEDTEVRSRRAMAKLEKLEGFLNAEAPDLRNLRTRARQVSKTMLDDLENWRITVESRNIST
jgi:hypothetical protein